MKKIIKSDKKETSSVFSKFYNKNSKKILSKKEAIKIYNNLSNNDKKLLQSIQSSVLQNFYFNYSLAVIKWRTVCLNVYAKALECQNILNLAANFNDQTSELQQGLDDSGPFGELAGLIIGLIGAVVNLIGVSWFSCGTMTWSYISFFYLNLFRLENQLGTVYEHDKFVFVWIRILTFQANSLFMIFLK